MAIATEVKTYQNLINGQWVNSDSGKTYEDRNPARPEEVVGNFQSSNATDVERAVEAAKAALPEWRAKSSQQRAQILYKAANILESRADEVARDMTREEGKTIGEAKGETLRAVAILRYFAGEGSQPQGDVLPATNPQTFLYTKREPLGVVGVITPWNFPIAIPAWKIAPAIVYGNTVVFKPAEITPLTAVNFVRALHDAGLPVGVVNLLTGSSRNTGNALVDNPAIAALSFTGSTKVGKSVQQRAIERGAKVQLEMGGKNPSVVLADAPLDLAVRDVANGAMLSTGQKCTATSRVIVERAIADTFIPKLVERIKSMKVGDGLDPATEIGPLSSQSQLDTTLEYIKIAKDEGCELLAGGEALQGDKYGNGYYVQPTLFGGMQNDMRIAQEEVFGPVLGVMIVDSAEEAFKLANDVKYGLSSAVFTRDIGKAMQFVDSIEAGIVHVNSQTAGAEPNAPFGGMKDSSNLQREQGKAAIEFFTVIKTVYFDRP